MDTENLPEHATIDELTPDARALVESDPERYKILKNGTVRDAELGRIVKGPPPGRRVIQTSEDGLRLREERKRLLREAIEASLVSNSKHSPDVIGGLRTMTDVQVEIGTQQVSAMDGSRMRAANEAYKTVMRYGGFVEERSRAGDSLPANLVAPAVAMAGFLAGLQAASSDHEHDPDNDTVEGEWFDIEELE